MIQENCRIVDHKQIAPSYFKITILSPYISSHALPGQFVEIRISQTTAPLLRKPFSIHKIDPAKQSIEILYEICGPKVMLKAVAEITQQKKLPCQLSMEAYMACGVGACKGCAVKTKIGYQMACKDGPVFKAEDIVWQI